MRPIDADALIADLEHDVKLDENMLCNFDLAVNGREEIVQFDKDCKENAIDLLRRAPTIDAVRVVHCEECKYCRRENVTYRYPDGTEREVVDRYINCTKERYQPEVRLDDFCSKGVRREEDDENQD